ncbi:MAG: hypothetical protein WA708_18225 [Acidobacteriaceae bacterium]
MSTQSVTTVPAAPVKKENAFESFFTKFGDALKDIANVAVNVGEQEAAVIEPLLPPTAAAGFAKILSAAAAQVAAADAKYAAIGDSNVPYAVKVAEAVAVGGEGVLAIAAQEGFTVAQGEVSTLMSAAGTIASTLNFTGLTEAPVVPATPAS